MRIGEDIRDRQTIPEGWSGDARRGGAGRQQRRGAKAQRQGRGERAAAQGAEEGSAPQARRV
ncbi:MAG TPA: hypothetical protein VFJ64_00920 [Solirubrobacterales bacterium]|nr:hypothetical protein [Solirubrobacterales bacterium]